MAGVRYSVVIPVYKNEASVARLLEALAGMQAQLDAPMEVVFVVDGSPDQSYARLQAALPSMPFAAQLLGHSRNFGSFAAIRTGLAAARGEFFGVMAADLQEPPELVVRFFQTLAAGGCDVVIGTRAGRQDPWASRLSSTLFWGLYRKLVVKDMPKGGVDVFGCNRPFRDELLRLEESRSSLIALIFWLGFRRELVAYERAERQEGVSGWTLAKKVDYMLDSVFAFTDLPIRLLTRMGLACCALALVLGLLVVITRLAGGIGVPGYAATMLVVLFFGGLNALGLGLVGTYAWRAYENTKRRPLAVVSQHLQFEGRLSHD